MPPAPPLVLALPRQARVQSFADGCRAAALDFVNRVGASADKAQLAEWLRGPYRTHVVALSRTRTRRIEASSVLPGALARLFAQTRLEVGLALLRTRDPEEGVSFGYTAMATGLVYRCQDAGGEQGWVPVAQPRMRLAERVLSLFAADYLLRGEDYERGLFTCTVCDELQFDASRRAAGVCRAHEARAHSDIRELAHAGQALAAAGEAG